MGVRTSLSSLQAIPTQIRGGIFTVVGSGGFTEAGISQGPWASYRAAVGNRALIKGVVTLRALGTNTLIEPTVFDTVNGRIIPIAQINVANPKQNFEVEVDRNFTMSMRGDNAANDGSCELISFIQEVPV